MSVLAPAGRRMRSGSLFHFSVRPEVTLLGQPQGLGGRALQGHTGGSLHILPGLVGTRPTSALSLPLPSVRGPSVVDGTP